MPPGPPNGAHKPGIHPSGYAMPRVPLPPYHGGPPSQPYAIPTHSAVHGPVGAVPQIPQPGNRGFGAGRGNSSAPIGSHLPHQQGGQPPIGSLPPNFNFPSMENANSQPNVAGPLSQPGYVSNVSTIVTFIYFLLLANYILWTRFKNVQYLFCKIQVTGQGPSQPYRDGFSMGGMSQVIYLAL